MNPATLDDTTKDQLLSLFKNERVMELLDSAGGDIHTWDTSDLPPEEWGFDILEIATKTAETLPYVNRWDSKNGRSVHVPIEEYGTETWVTTILASARASASTYDARVVKLDPGPYRLMMQIANDSIEEATWSVEANVRKRLATYASLKLDTLVWSSLSTSALSNTKYQCAGESLENTTTGNAIDYGTALTVDKCTDAIFAVRTASYGNARFRPRVGFITTGMAKDLSKDSALQSSSEYGGNQLIRSGDIPDFLGVKWIITNNIPQDSGSTDIGLVVDPDHFWIGNVPKMMEFKAEPNTDIDGMEFFIKIKAAFAVGVPNSGSVLYT